MTSTVKTDVELANMRTSGRILATILDILKGACEAGKTPRDMSELAKQELRRLGGEPPFLGFHGYPDVICISVNDQVQHAIPSGTPFVNGDVVNLDFGVRYKGMITDAGITICVGNKTTPEVERLLKGTERALYDGLSIVKDGCRIGDISATIERTLRKHKLGIVRELVGHGVGNELHEEPEIPNYGRAGSGPILKTGMTIAIEPITTLGDAAIYQAPDGWTLLTRDGSLSAQFEHTIVVTPTGCEILTSL
jgi:methionyl aminopeptidase